MEDMKKDENGLSLGAKEMLNAAERAKVLVHHVESPKSSQQLFGTIDDNQKKHGFQQLGEPIALNSQVAANIKERTAWLDNLKLNPRMYWPKKYRYTAEPRPGVTCSLSVRERDHYEKNGYLVMKGVLPKGDIRRLSDFILKGSECKMQDGELGLSAPLLDLIKNGQLLRYAEAFCGPNIMAMNGVLIEDRGMAAAAAAAEAEADSNPNAFSFYQDLFVFPFRPADRIVGFWTPIHPLTESNSSFTLIPKSHRCSQLQATFKDGQGFDTRIIYEPLPDLVNIQRMEDQRKSVSLMTGDVLFYHPLLLYTLLAKSSSSIDDDSSGKETMTVGLSGHYASSECDYVQMSGLNPSYPLLPPHLVQRNNGTPIEVLLDKEDWKRKAILVKGRRVNL